MEEIIMLGTGNATATKCYNTCFAFKVNQEYFLIDAGGGNGILTQLECANIELKDIKNMFVTHCHSDHILGVIWIFRMIATLIVNNQYDANFNIYCHDEAKKTIQTIVELTLQKKLYDLIGTRIFINEVKDGQQVNIVNMPITFFDIHSSKIKQFGFTIDIPGNKITCLGDEPYNQLCYQYAINSKWLLCEAFCLDSQKDIFKPYQKHHSTVKDAALVAKQLNVENLVLYHSEDKNIAKRKLLYTNEAKQFFYKDIYVPDDLERIIL